MSAERPSGGASSDRNRERRSSTTGSIHGAGEPTFLGDIAIKVSYVIKTHMVYHGGNTNPPHMLLRFFEERSPMAPTLMNICGTIELLQQTARIEDYALVLATMNLERVLQMWEGSIFPAHATWRMLFLVSLIVSSKLFYDEAVYNEDFAQAVPMISLRRIAKAELAFCHLCAWSPAIPTDRVAKYKDELYNFAAFAISPANLPLLRLDDTELDFLATRQPPSPAHTSPALSYQASPPESSSTAAGVPPVQHLDLADVDDDEPELEAAAVAAARAATAAKAKARSVVVPKTTSFVQDEEHSSFKTAAEHESFRSAPSRGKTPVGEGDEPVDGGESFKSKASRCSLGSTTLDEDSFKSTLKRCSPVTAPSDFGDDVDDDTCGQSASSGATASVLSAAGTSMARGSAAPSHGLRLSSSNIRRLEAQSGHAPAEGRSVFGFGKWALLNLPLPGAGNRSGGRSGGQTPRSRERSGRHTPERE